MRAHWQWNAGIFKNSPRNYGAGSVGFGPPVFRFALNTAKPMPTSAAKIPPIISFGPVVLCCSGGADFESFGSVILFSL